MTEECVIAVCGRLMPVKVLIGVLTSGELDDGRGKSRKKILKHKHELDSGRTSNITLNPIKYKIDKDELLLCDVTKEKVLNKVKFKNNNFKNDKIISFMDLAGHEKYLKNHCVWSYWYVSRWFCSYWSKYWYY